MKILLVDDEPRILDPLARSITRSGHTVVKVLWEDGEHNLKDAQVKAADVLLIDMGLGVDDGLAVAEDLRRRFPSKPIVLNSANPFNGERARAGGFKFVEKGDIAGLKWLPGVK